MAASCPVLVGRDAELSRLLGLLEKAAHGEGGVALVSGEAGIGKSRLLNEVIGAARQRGIVPWRGRALAGSATDPYRPVTEAVLACLRERSVLSEPELDLWRPALAAVVPTLVAPSTGEIPPIVRAEAVIRLFERAASGPALVVLEDLHWADAETLEFLSFAASNLSDRRILIVASARNEPRGLPADVARLVAERVVTHVPLGRIDLVGIEAMVRACRGQTDLDTVERLARASEGVPFLIEELVDAQDIPATFTDSVSSRISRLNARDARAIKWSAVSGRHVDVAVVARSMATDEATVLESLEAARDESLVTRDGDGYAFRHALARDAIIGLLTPSERSDIARRILDVIDPMAGSDSRQIEFAADLAVAAGDSERAAQLLERAGRMALDRGALATAVQSFRGAIDRGARRAAVPLVEALALSGRVDEALHAADAALAELHDDASIDAVRLNVARVALPAGRLELASEMLAALVSSQDDAARARAQALRAELHLVEGDLDEAQRLADVVLGDPTAPVDARCHASEVVGRSLRPRDRASARRAFERAANEAATAGLAIWRARALHEMGTVDMFAHAGDELLREARRVTITLGAVGTVAVIDLQLSAVGHVRFDLDRARESAHSAQTLGERLGLVPVEAKAWMMLCENAAWRDEPELMYRAADRALTLAPNDRMLAAFALGARGMRHLFRGERHSAVAPLQQAESALRALTDAEPAAFRATLPLLLASLNDPGSTDAIRAARSSNIVSIELNVGLLAVADTINLGRRHGPQRARERFDEARGHFVNCATWVSVASWLAAESAASEGWDDPRWWLDGASATLENAGLGVVARRCRSLEGSGRWHAVGVTAREGEVLALVAAGLANKQISSHLKISTRTVEKHLESLLRKLDAPNRSTLISLFHDRSEPT